MTESQLTCHDGNLESARQSLINRLAEAVRWSAVRGGKISRTRERVGNRCVVDQSVNSMYKRQLSSVAADDGNSEFQFFQGRRAERTRAHLNASATLWLALSQQRTGHPQWGFASIPH